MMIISRTFGTLAPTQLDAEATVQRGEDPVRLDLNLEPEASPSQATIDEVDACVDDLDALDARARAELALLLDDDTQQPIKFWQFHHDEVEGYEHLTRERFIATLRLVRAGFYPAATGDDSWLTLDYQLRGPDTDQLLVAKLRADRSIIGVCWES